MAANDSYTLITGKTADIAQGAVVWKDVRGARRHTFQIEGASSPDATVNIWARIETDEDTTDAIIHAEAVSAAGTVTVEYDGALQQVGVGISSYSAGTFAANSHHVA